MLIYPSISAAIGADGLGRYLFPLDDQPEPVRLVKRLWQLENSLNPGPTWPHHRLGRMLPFQVWIELWHCYIQDCTLYLRQRSPQCRSIFDYASENAMTSPDRFSQPVLGDSLVGLLRNLRLQTYLFLPGSLRLALVDAVRISSALTRNCGQGHHFRGKRE